MSLSCNGPVQWGNYRISYTYSKALDNVGEFFFSAPINNFNIWQDYGRSDDDQRNRLTFDGTIHPSMGKRRQIGNDSAHGFQLTSHAPVLFAPPIQHHDWS